MPWSRVGTVVLFGCNLVQRVRGGMVCAGQVGMEPCPWGWVSRDHGFCPVGSLEVWTSKCLGYMVQKQCISRPCGEEQIERGGCGLVVVMSPALWLAVVALVEGPTLWR